MFQSPILIDPSLAGMGGIGGMAGAPVGWQMQAPSNKNSPMMTIQS